MARILISLLGTGRQEKNNDQKNEYIGVDYLIENNLYEKEKFVL